MVIAGHSQGGWAAIAAASVRIEGVLGTVNICGGTNYASMGSGMVTRAVREHWIESCGVFGKSAVSPMLWIYPENDHILSPADIHRMHRAYQDAGGRATLALKPPYGTNGHYIVGQPELFMEDIMAFFTAIGFAGGADRSALLRFHGHVSCLRRTGNRPASRDLKGSVV